MIDFYFQIIHKNLLIYYIDYIDILLNSIYIYAFVCQYVYLLFIKYKI